MATKTAERRYEVTITLKGTAHRIITASSKEEALAKGQKMLVDKDGTPLNRMLVAFCWEEWFSAATVCYQDMTEEELYPNRIKPSEDKPEELPT